MSMPERKSKVDNVNGPIGLVLAPTRELAIQVCAPGVHVLPPPCGALICLCTHRPLAVSRDGGRRCRKQRSATPGG